MITRVFSLIVCRPLKLGFFRISVLEALVINIKLLAEIFDFSNFCSIFVRFPILVYFDSFLLSFLDEFELLLQMEGGVSLSSCVFTALR